MSTINLTRDNFQGTVSEHSMVVVNFWASGRTLSPTFDSVADLYPGLFFGRVNAEEEQGLAEMLGIRSTPTLMIMRDSVILYSEPGWLEAAMLQGILDRARALDMDKVREEIAVEREARAALDMRRVCPTARGGPAGSQR